MKKLLTLALALVMAAGFSTAASAVELSGDILIRGEAYNNVNDWSDDAGNADRFTAQRTSLNIDANPTDGVTVHVGLEAVNIWGASVQHCGGSEIVGPGLESVSYNCSDYSGTPKVFEAYIVAADLFGSGVTAKVGKQQINFGAERIIGTDHAWALHPTTFDAWAFVVPAGPATIVLADVKLSEGGEETPGVGNYSGDTDLYVIHATLPVNDAVSVDAYYMQLDANSLDTGYINNTDNIDLQTIGLRVSGATMGIDYDIEYAFQGGTIEDVENSGSTDIDIAANMLALEVGYSLPDMYNVRVFAGYDSASGSTVKDLVKDEAGTWISLSPSWDKHLGAFDLFDRGNLTATHVGVTADFSENCSFGLSWWDFTLTEENTAGFVEGYYAPGDNLPLIDATATIADEDEVGTELDLFVTHTFNDNLSATLGYSTFDVGSALVAATDDDDTATFSYLQLQAKF